MRCVFVAGLLLATGACSTVLKTNGEVADAGSNEREALRAAAAEVAQTPWPKPSSSTLADRLAGAPEDAEKVSRDDAVKAYAGRLRAAPSAETVLMADAERHLEAARAMMKVAEETGAAARVRMSDVALIEDAIADLRETRAIYVACLKKIDADDAAADRLKESFKDVIKDLGDVADDLAENAMKNNPAAQAPNATIVAARE